MHAVTLDAAKAGVERLVRARTRELEEAVRAALPGLCAGDALPVGPGPVPDQGPGVSRLGEHDPRPEDRPAGDLLALAGAVERADVVLRELGAHPEWFSPLRRRRWPSA